MISNLTTPLPAAALPAATQASTGFWRRLLRVAWLSIALGVGIELLLLVLAAASGSLQVAPLLADLSQKVSWSLIVCVGLALGTTAGRRRSDVMGLLGLISAPLGFQAARTLHKGVAQALGLVAGAAGAAVFVVAALKGLEYGILGAAIGGWGRRRGTLDLRTHLLVGTVVGVVFGGAILFVLARAASPALGTADLLAKAINELLFPVGCAFVLYASEALGSRVR